jgi:hypothetical protein
METTTTKSKSFHLFLLFSILTMNVFGQAPCGTNFTGFDACFPEPLSMSTNCAGSSEEFRTNGCLGLNPAASSCGLAAGANIVWGSFYVSVGDNVTITWLASNSRNIRFGIYQFTDACLGTGETEIACVNNGGNGVDETITLFLAPGQYWICGESSGNLSAASTICVFSPNAPSPVIASDCGIGVNVCTNLSFMVDPNGEGAITNEIPPSGSLGNPLYDGFTTFNPWGTTNSGCLQIDESNSTWMYVNISGSGNLEFVFGGSGAQAGFYDWIMYPATATCASIQANTVAPVRCNWNLVDNGGTGLVTTVPVGGDAGNFEPPLPVIAGEVYIICFSNYSSIQTAVPLEFSGTASVSCLPLPVELLYAKSELVNRSDVHISWATASEKNNDYFSIERSSDGIVFDEIGTVAGMGNSTSLTEYKFTDKYPIQGMNYYRLRQVDFDGVFSYSGIMSQEVQLQEEIQLYPNPSAGLFTLRLSTDSRLESIEVMNNSGVTVYQDSQNLIRNGLIEIDLNNIETGNYIVRITDRFGKKINKRICVIE